MTQRVEHIPGYGETRDCLDQRWVEFLNILGMIVIPIPNALKNVEEWLDVMKCDAYLLTGGNDLADLPSGNNSSVERDLTEFALLRYAKSRSKPVFGVCRGLQLINVFLGGQLDRVHGHAGTRHSIMSCFDRSDRFLPRDVNSFHDWGITANSLSGQLIPCAYDADNHLESARHVTLNWLGIMWHPEREIQFRDSDLEILRKLFNEGFN